ncbi:methyltransferase domain-containing protein [Clostridium brassicae]|uniref:Methyltransferase domain-containing protein n=1 Tax=Clostridium brassicae TaxID=2999072 RepID=A0ABT4D9R9_9CLOT|nr:methyltransferase domain-containing protein [Clostridium brassicae]MCY6959030.1 methyltransferase domain-containing protein [Clostridium brassicae]
MKEEIIISIKDEKLNGNLLDIGTLNYGIIYNIYKSNNKDFKVEYVDSKKNKIPISKGCYDICTLFLAFSNIMFKKSKRTLLQEIYSYLKEDGYIYIWDIDKKFGEILDGNVKVLMDNNKVKEFTIKDYNILKDSSEKSIFDLVNKYFDIIYAKKFSKVYCIKARKKRRIENEGDSSWH